MWGSVEDGEGEGEKGEGLNTRQNGLDAGMKLDSKLHYRRTRTSGVHTKKTCSSSSGTLLQVYTTACVHYCRC